MCLAVACRNAIAMKRPYISFAKAVVTARRQSTEVDTIHPYAMAGHTARRLHLSVADNHRTAVTPRLTLPLLLSVLPTPLHVICAGVWPCAGRSWHLRRGTGVRCRDRDRFNGTMGLCCAALIQALHCTAGEGRKKIPMA